MKRENLRRVKCSFWIKKRVECVDEAGEKSWGHDDVLIENEEGYFHEWNGGKAIIELEDGTIIQTPYWFVQFIS